MSDKTFNIPAAAGPSLWYVGTDETLYRLDREDGLTLKVPCREMAIATALAKFAFGHLLEVDE